MIQRLLSWLSPQIIVYRLVMSAIRRDTAGPVLVAPAVNKVCRHPTARQPESDSALQTFHRSATIQALSTVVTAHGADDGTQYRKVRGDAAVFATAPT